MPTLADLLVQQTREAEVCRPLDQGRVECLACGHKCHVFPGLTGVCKVRFNREGTLYAPHGYVNAAFCDPIEKLPFHHVYPGCRALSFGMLGCDLHCGYCQDWASSQSLRDPRAAAESHPTSPDELVSMALRQGAACVVSTYNEPLITAEWAASVFREAHNAGFVTGFASNGNATPEVLEYLRPWVDLYKVDLKSFEASHYRELGGRLGPVLDSIARIHEMGFWLEVVTLVIPGFNDSTRELRAMADFLARISPDIPWHVTAFHRDYKMQEPENTPALTLIRAVEIGRAAGLRYVYAGNLPGETGDLEDTRCPQCHATLISRRGYRMLSNVMGPGGTCPHCGTSIPGVWAS